MAMARAGLARPPFPLFLQVVGMPSVGHCGCFSRSAWHPKTMLILLSAIHVRGMPPEQSRPLPPPGLPEAPQPRPFPGSPEVCTSVPLSFSPPASLSLDRARPCRPLVPAGLQGGKPCDPLVLGAAARCAVRVRSLRRRPTGNQWGRRGICTVTDPSGIS